jgi:hypothetical protein
VKKRSVSAPFFLLFAWLAGSPVEPRAQTVKGVPELPPETGLALPSEAEPSAISAPLNLPAESPLGETGRLEASPLPAPDATASIPAAPSAETAARQAHNQVPVPHASVEHSQTSRIQSAAAPTSAAKAPSGQPQLDEMFDGRRDAASGLEAIENAEGIPDRVVEEFRRAFADLNAELIRAGSDDPLVRAQARRRARLAEIRLVVLRSRYPEIEKAAFPHVVLPPAKPAAVEASKSPAPAAETDASLRVSGPPARIRIETLHRGGYRDSAAPPSDWDEVHWTQARAAIVMAAEAPHNAPLPDGWHRRASEPIRWLNRFIDQPDARRDIVAKDVEFRAALAATAERFDEEPDTPLRPVVFELEGKLQSYMSLEHKLARDFHWSRVRTKTAEIAAVMGAAGTIIGGLILYARLGGWLGVFAYLASVFVALIGGIALGFGVDMAEETKRRMILQYLLRVNPAALSDLGAQPADLPERARLRIAKPQARLAPPPPAPQSPEPPAEELEDGGDVPREPSRRKL